MTLSVPLSLRAADVLGLSVPLLLSQRNVVLLSVDLLLILHLAFKLLLSLILAFTVQFSLSICQSTLMLKLLSPSVELWLLRAALDLNLPVTVTLSVRLSVAVEALVPTLAIFVDKVISFTSA